MSSVSVITPAYNEAQNLLPLYERLTGVFDGLQIDWEWIAMDDHSTDGTPQILHSLIEQDSRVKTVRFSRNFGSHAAIACGLRYSTGDCVVIMAADLQDPPEFIPRLLEHWKSGAKVVWGIREKREAESFLTKAFSRLYYWLLRNVAMLKDTPATGADMWLMDRQVVNAINADSERHSSVTTLVRWMGFVQDSIFYTKAPRQHGKSKWSLAKKLTHVLDTFVSSTVVPIRFMSYLGFLIALVGFIYALIVVKNALSGHPLLGWPSLMVVTLLTSGIQMVMLGVLGEYLWRTYEESRGRPRYIVESASNIEMQD